MELNGDYSVWQVQCRHLHIISHFQDFHSHALLKTFKKTWSTSFLSHINLRWLCNPRFDYSKTFGGFARLYFALAAPPMPSQGALIHSTLIPKSCLCEHKRYSTKFMEILYCPPQLSKKSISFLLYVGN